MISGIRGTHDILPGDVERWQLVERIARSLCDRYGYVYLLADGDSTTATCRYARMSVIAADVGKPVTLKALVTETRPSTHVGDWFRGVFPVTPEIGETITLGRGALATSKNCEGKLQVGIKPEDGRGVDWLDIKALYRCHEQTVELFYEPMETAHG